jgi:hypothetical protein
MSSTDIQKRWQSALRIIYPGVILYPMRYPEGEEDRTPYFSVFMIPDEQRPTFINFFINERPALMERECLPDALLNPVSVTETRKLYPEIYREAMAEKTAQATSRTPRKVTRARRTPVAKKTVSTH